MGRGGEVPGCLSGVLELGIRNGDCESLDADFEPDKENWRLSRCWLRGCKLEWPRMDSNLSGGVLCAGR